MIVYYDPLKFNILGISGQLDKTRTEPYIQTDDPRVLNIFLGKDKVSKYEVFIDPESNKGYLKIKHSEVSGKPIKDRIYLVPDLPIEHPEIKFKQDSDNKTVTVFLSEAVLAQMKAEKKSLQFFTAKSTDPYQMLWVKYIPYDSLALAIKVPYQGSDSFRIFTEKVFESYQHEYP